MPPRRPKSPRVPLILVLAAPLLGAACTDSPTDPLAGPDPQAVAVRQQAVGHQTALAAQDRHTAALLSLGGVLGVGVGADGLGGHTITVYTLRPGAPTLPAAVDGVPLVSVVTGLVVAGDVNDPTTRERPAPNGFSIGHPDITAGTLGAIVKDALDNRFILSNNHVLANSNNASIGDPSLQPGPFDGGTSSDRIGTLAAFQTINFSGANNTIDAAISSVNGADVTALTPSYAYGAPGTSPVSAFVGQGVQKFGRTTGHTTGSVAETNVTVDVCYQSQGPVRCVRLARFVDQIGISDGSFSDGGDSGSLIVTNDAGKNPVGLLFAGSSTRTIANPIDDVLAAFDVTITADPGQGGEPGNDPPVASFTFSCTDLTCDFDGTGSADGDGTIQSYAWAFGDGGNGGGATTSHTYAAGGTYTVTLTVTDDDGAPDSDSQNVSVTDPAGGGFTLSTTGYKVRGLQKADLSWSGATTTNVDIYRNGALLTTTANDGFFTDNIDQRGGGSYQYQVCEAGSTTCSNTSAVAF